MEKGHIVFVIPFIHFSYFEQILREYFCILIDGPVLDDGFRGFGNQLLVTESMRQEIDLEMERPPMHVSVEIGQIRIVFHGFEVRFPMVSFGEKSCERGFPGSDISGDGNENGV